MAEQNALEVAFGELILTFTSKFELMWNDRNSGARRNVSFFRPIPPAGFHALASIGRPDYQSADGLEAAMCVKEANGNWAKPPLATPQDYDFLWKDAKSGASLSGSCWRPIPPSGYVALGDVFVPGYGKPPTDMIRCVATELATEGRIGEEIWLDHKSGRNVHDFGSWEIVASNPILDTPDGVFAVNSFVGRTGRHAYDKPSSAPVAYNLRLPLPTTVFEEPARPVLDSRNRPPGSTNPTVDRVVTVPFTSVLDEEKDLFWKVTNSPFYYIERVIDYRLVLFINNDSNIDQKASTSITTGISREESETFSHSTGITISQEVGIEAGGFGSKASISMTYSFGYSQTSASTIFRQETDEVELTASPNTAAAVWTGSTAFRSKRSDGSQVAEPLGFDPTDTDYAFSHFPKSADCKRTRSAGISVWRHRLTAARTGYPPCH